MDKLIIKKVCREIKKSFPQCSVAEEPITFITVLATMGITGKRALSLYQQHAEELGRKPLPSIVLDMLLDASLGFEEMRKEVL